MLISDFTDYLYTVFEDKSLFGFSSIDERLSEKTHCKRALVALLPHADLYYNYNEFEFYKMNDQLGKMLSGKMSKIKAFLDQNGVKHVIPPASPKDDGSFLAEFSYKWAAIHAGLGFIGKNDVFVHYKFGQRVRISCLLVDLNVTPFSGEIHSECGSCDLCVQACPYGYISGRTWNVNIHREELIDYKRCAAKSSHDGDGRKYLCAYCSLACRYHCS